MAFFSKKSNPLMNVIRCDEPSYLIWKWRPAGEPADSNRANAIRWGSSLRVKPGSVAVLAYQQPDGYIYDYIEGPADLLLETSNLPVLADIIGRAYDGGSPFQAEVYFINLAEIIQVQFGVPYFDVFDPRFSDFGVPTAIRGTITFKIADYPQFIRLHRLDNFDLKTFQLQIRDAIIKIVKGIVANAPSTYSIPVLQIERKITEISNLVEEGVRIRLHQDFGVCVSAVDLSAIEVDKTSDGYQQLKAVTQDISTLTIQAKAEIDIKTMRDTQRIGAEHAESILKAQREETQYAQRIQTQTEHLATHQLNQQAAVGIAGAEALGQGAGSTASTGLNPAAMMAGMTIGSAMGQNVANMMTSMMPGTVTNTSQPPVPPTVSPYYVAINGQAAGPYEITILRQMANAGTLTSGTLVWTAGMSTWISADKVQELKDLFIGAPTIPPDIPIIPSN